MFGYVRPPLDDLPKEEAERFCRIYCGLCHTLKRRYGSAAQFILNYDFTYLAILLSAAQEDEIRQGRCIVSPVKKREYFAESDALTVAADESVILAYWQMRDGVSDHDFVHGAKYRAGALALERAYRKAAKNRPAFDAVTRQQLEILSALEKENCANPDLPAGCFGRLMGELLVYEEDGFSYGCG